MAPFNYYVAGVPDIDQRWELLPNDGKMYCFPTSALNWIYYLRNHGFPNITFPEHPIYGDKVYNLLMMGGYMDTDSVEGTSLSDLVDGLEDWFDDFGVPANVFIRSMYSNDGVGFGVLKYWALYGGMMTLLRARYIKIKSSPLKLRRKKKSGHMVTIVGLKENGTDRLIIVNDPASGDDDLNQQSNKVEHDYPVFPIKATFQKYDYEDYEVDEEEKATALRITKSVDPYKIIEGYSVIFPQFTLTNTSGTTVTYYSANFENGGTNEFIIPLPFEGVVDIAIKPGFAEAYLLAANKSSVWKVDLSTREVTKFKEIPGAERIIFGGARNNLYSLHKKTLKMMNSAGKKIAQISLDDVPNDIAFDYQRNRVVALTNDKVISLSGDLQLKDKQVIPVPVKGTRQLFLNQRSGDIIFSDKVSFGVSRLATPFSAPSTNQSSRVKSSASKIATGGKHLWVNKGEIEMVNDKGQQIQSIFNGLKAGPIVRMSGNYTLVDPEIVNNEEYFY